MPTYGYQCTQCKHEFSVFQAMKDAALTRCPECEGTIKRLLYPVGVIFKGSGWYVNDSRKPEKASEESATGAKSDAEKSGESGGGATDSPTTTATAEKASQEKPTTSESKSAASGVEK